MMPPQQFNSLKRRNASLLFQYRPVIIALSMVVVIFAFYRFFGFGLANEPICPKQGLRYGIMFDAGSTGSRIHVFEFEYKNNDITLLREVFEQTKPGLSSYANNLDGIEQSLKPLLDVAVREVPVSLRACTPMLLKATAGLRLVGAEKAEMILSVVRSLFARYPFKVPVDGVALMDGVDEGPFAWLTVNFLLGRFTTPQKSATAGIMDLGGGSTQIVFEPDSEDTLRKAPASSIRTISLFGRTYTIYQHSYLGYGLKEAGKKIKRALIRAFSSPGGAEMPCLVPSSEEMFETKLLKGKKEGTLDECMLHVEEALDKNAACPLAPCSFQGVYMPKLSATFSGDWYIFSYFYDLVETHLEATKSDVLTVSDFKALAEKACREGSKGTSNCLDMSFLYGLLAKGYDLPEGTKLTLKKKINGIETAWALGAMITAM